MPQIVVFNKHLHPDMSWCTVVNVMRPVSVLANPSHITTTCSREEAIAKYRIWLDKMLKDVESPQYKELQRLVTLYREGNDIGLLCCCAPAKACHADVIARAIKYFANLAAAQSAV